MIICETMRKTVEKSVPFQMAAILLIALRNTTKIEQPLSRKQLNV